MTKSKVRLTSHYSNLVLFTDPYQIVLCKSITYSTLYKIEKLNEISFGHPSFAKDVLFITFPF